MRAFPAVIVLGLLAAKVVAGSEPIPASVVSDSPANRAFPAAMEVAAIPSHASTMHGVIYVAPGAGPHPTLLLMHGFPGDEQNLDLAQAVRRSGWNVLTFHYRGSWGSEGTFSFGHAFEDADAAIAFLRDPGNAKRFRIDAKHIVAAGHSMGGILAAHAAANDPAIMAVALISPWNIGGDAAGLKSAADRAEAVKGAAENMEALSGCTPAGLVAEMIAHQTEWNFISYAPALKDRPLLLTTADDGNTPDAEALLAAIHKAGGRTITEVYFATDHSYSDDRIGLEAAFVRWLQTLALAQP